MSDVVVGKFPSPTNKGHNFGSSHDGGNGGGDDMLEKRVKQLEDHVAAMRTDIAVMKSNYATKEDIALVRTEVHQAISTQTKWLAGSMVAIAGLAIALAKIIF
ncbi:hemolysin XhlA [Pantoea allii]|uniref:hemolysin XhlA n=1 Tax=Pantoea allii TaxID=574096 RepID=UPI0024B6A3F5|nr:hemolysin XhlA [Pantoea allii]MDJ0042938.1 hemolysin XhlA [Pantoea allii]